MGDDRPGTTRKGPTPGADPPHHPRAQHPRARPPRARHPPRLTGDVTRVEDSMVAWFTVLVPEVLTLAGMVVVVAALAVAPPLALVVPPRRRRIRAVPDAGAIELATGTQAFDPAGDGSAERRWPQLLGPRPRPAAATRRCRPPSTGPWPPCWPRPGRPPARRLPGPRPARRGHAGRRTRGGPALARLGHGTLASLHHGASSARSTACVGIAGGSETILVRMVATGKTRARPGTWSWGSPRGSRGGRGRVRALTRCRAPTGAPSFQTPC
jgi:hypothetical protein